MLNEIIDGLFADELVECQEGIFESALSADDLTNRLRAHFSHNPVLDGLIVDFLEQLA